MSNTVFRIHTNRRFALSNHHLMTNKTLSLKAKGLLSLMLSLPEQWDYTMDGLSYITGESLEKITTAMKELIAAGYVERFRLRNEKGQMAGAEYIVYEWPHTADDEGIQAAKGGKKRQFTLVSASIIKDMRLSLKARGLLLLMISLPHNWDFNLKGLAYFCKDGIYAIRSGIYELEKYGYLKREKIEGSRCQNYIINENSFEQSDEDNDEDSQNTENNTKSDPENRVGIKKKKNKKKASRKKKDVKRIERRKEIPIRENYFVTKPIRENQSETKVDKNNTNKLNNTSIHHSTKKVTCITAEDRQKIEENVRQMTGYNYIQNPANRCFLDTITEVITDVLSSANEIYNICDMNIPGVIVKKRFEILNQHHVQYVLNRLNTVTEPIRNVYGYVRSMLWNAVPVMDTDYALQVNADVYAYNSFDCTAICV